MSLADKLDDDYLAGVPFLIFLECGVCGHYHLSDYLGDCRNDTQRFTIDEAESYPEEHRRIVDLDEQVDGIYYDED